MSAVKYEFTQNKGDMNSYPVALAELIALFESLPEGERRENLIDLASAAPYCAPRVGETFDIEDMRHDAECTDKVGVHVRIGKDGLVHFAITLGPNVQTLTKALATLFWRGLNGLPLDELLTVPRDFIPRIIGSELVRLRSRTVYYLLDRIKAAAEILIRPEMRLCSECSS